MIKHFKRNTTGRDFAVGDIHGCFSMLQDILGKIEFDEARDRLFSVGDLVDRGPTSEESIDWLAKPWFHAVRGNHEQMAIDYVNENRYDEQAYIRNGGGWNVNQKMARRMVYADIFADLPLAIEVDTASGPIGIVHADCPFATWGEFRTALQDTPSGLRLDAIANVAMWSRDRFKHLRDDGVRDLRAMVVGHTPMRDGVTNLGNVYFIDTGAGKGKHLSVIHMDSLPLGKLSPCRAIFYP